MKTQPDTATLSRFADSVQPQPLRLDVGVYALADPDYQADPCREPSLRASGFKTLLDKTPRHFLIDHPRLSSPAPDDDAEERPENKAQRLGSIVHKLILGRGKTLHVCDFPDWRTGAAKNERADATIRGDLAVLPKELAQAERIFDAARPQLEREYGGWPLGDSEQTLIWRRQTAHGEIFGRAMLDHWSDDRQTIVDLKTTALSVDDESLAKKFAGEGGAYQVAWHTEGAEALHPHLRGRVEFDFAVVEIKPPYCVRRVALPEAWVHMARRRIDTAADTFARCLKLGEWPRYPAGRTLLSTPGWLERKWLDEELSGEAA